MFYVQMVSRHLAESYDIVYLVKRVGTRPQLFNSDDIPVPPIAWVAIICKSSHTDAFLFEASLHENSLDLKPGYLDLNLTAVPLS